MPFKARYNGHALYGTPDGGRHLSVIYAHAPVVLKESVSAVDPSSGCGIAMRARDTHGGSRVVYKVNAYSSYIEQISYITMYL